MNGAGQVVPLAVDPELDPYVAPPLPGEPRPSLPPRELFVRSASSRDHAHAIITELSPQRGMRTPERVVVEWIQTCIPDWSSGRFVTLTVPPPKDALHWTPSYATQRRRLMSYYERWSQSLNTWA